MTRCYIRDLRAKTTIFFKKKSLPTLDAKSLPICCLWKMTLYCNGIKISIWSQKFAHCANIMYYLSQKQQHIGLGTKIENIDCLQRIKNITLLA